MTVSIKMKVPVFYIETLQRILYTVYVNMFIPRYLCPMPVNRTICNGEIIIIIIIVTTPTITVLFNALITVTHKRGLNM